MEVYTDKNKSSLEVGLGHGSQVGGPPCAELGFCLRAMSGMSKYFSEIPVQAWDVLFCNAPFNQNDTCPLGKSGAAALTARPRP